MLTNVIRFYENSVEILLQTYDSGYIDLCKSRVPVLFLHFRVKIRIFSVVFFSSFISSDILIR